jgi:peptidoglycan/LPS O-acetylase OafA/YrhL
MGKAVVLGILGCGAICFGSLVAGTFPGDGQTGMVAFPLWIVGGAFGITALLMAAFRREDRPSLLALLALAVLAIGSVFWSYKASERYIEEWYRMHPEVKKPK